MMAASESGGDWKKCLRHSRSYPYLRPTMQDDLKSEGRSSSYELLPPNMQDDLKSEGRSSSYELLPPNMSELRVVLLGSGWAERSSVGNFILRETKFNAEEEPDNCVRISTQWNNRKIVLINTPDLLDFHISQHKQSEFLESCVSLSAPGPHVFLLVLQPEDFSAEHKKSLCRVLQLFSEQSFDHSLILISTPREEEPGFMEKYRQKLPIKDMIRRCRHRYVWQKNLGHSELLKQLSQIAKENRGEHLRCDGFEDEDAGLTLETESEQMKPSLNLVLSGRRGAGKTSAAKAILGQKDIDSVSNSSECVKHQGEVCGRRLSLVELPALYGKPQEAVMEESFRCVSLCDPEGVHAFILVLPVAPLTDEDKEEFQIIQNTFGSRVNDFTMILFAVESDPADPAVVNFIRENRDIQELRQSCGGRSVDLNINNKQQIPELLDAVEKMRFEEPRCFTKDMFTRAQMEKLTRLRAELQDEKPSSEMGGNREDQLREPLRMVLVGKVGCGKSATANTILGGTHFKTRVPPKKPNTTCERAAGEADGRPVAVVNTPALFSTPPSDKEFLGEMKKCIDLLAPGPHVFLLVLRIGNFKAEEKDSVELMKKYFGKRSQDFTLIVFTRGDALEDVTFESYLSDCPDFVKRLIDDCGGRYQVFNNKEPENRTQVSELLAKIERMVKENDASCYTPEMALSTREETETQLETLLKEKEEDMRRKEENLKRKHTEDLRALEMKFTEERAKAEEERKLSVQQLKDKDKCVNMEREKRRREHEEQERKWKKQEEVQRQEWKRKQETLEKMVQSERQQRESAEKKLDQCRREMKRDRDAWDKERNNIWEKVHQEVKQNLEEEKTSHRKLQEEHLRKRRLWRYSLIALVVALVFVLYYVILRDSHTTQSAAGR